MYKIQVINYNTNEKGANAVAGDCTAQGAEAIVIKGNVAEDKDCVAMANVAIERWGRIDVLVNNAGTTKFVDHSNLEGLDDNDFYRIYGVNVIGAYQMVRECNEQMQKQDEGGAVINVASTAGGT